MMQNANAIITTMDDNIGQVIVTESADDKTGIENLENFQGESEDSIKKKCYVLRKLLAHQIKPNVGCLPHTIRAFPRIKPFRAFGSILDKGFPFSKLFSHPCTVETKSIDHSEFPHFQLLGPLDRENRNVCVKTDQVSSPFLKDNEVNIFGAMAVSIKADFLQSCAALLQKRVSKLINIY